jgi:hypothetical protein
MASCAARIIRVVSGHDSRLIVARCGKLKPNVGKSDVSDATATAEVMIRLRSTAISTTHFGQGARSPEVISLFRILGKRDVEAHPG